MTDDDDDTEMMTSERVHMSGHALAEILGITAEDLGVHDDADVTCWPDGRCQVYVDGQVIDLTVSIRDRARAALRAVAP